MKVRGERRSFVVGDFSGPQKAQKTQKRVGWAGAVEVQAIANRKSQIQNRCLFCPIFLACIGGL